MLWELDDGTRIFCWVWDYNFPTKADLSARMEISERDADKIRHAMRIHGLTEQAARVLVITGGTK